MTSGLSKPYMATGWVSGKNVIRYFSTEEEARKCRKDLDAIMEKARVARKANQSSRYRGGPLIHPLVTGRFVEGNSLWTLCLY